uniref:umecyanin-like n=1 Tax=Erigeron canadensis TaxID=72917 RepID=UPI001CB99D8B|nr:umecyanin-like [Erigeron canadensis]
MAGLKSMVIVLVVMMVASFQPQFAAAQTTHVVGGTIGWMIPSSGASAYTTWASGQTFRVGDSLLFNFTTGFHDVAEVSQTAYGPCTITNPISTTTTGPATLRLATAGNHYYICTFGTHCQIGQKLTINVAASTSTSPPSATSPAPSGPMPMSPDGMPMSPPPPSPSSASVFTAMVPVTFLAAVMALFY